MVIRKRTAPALKLARQASRQKQLEQRARLIGAGIEIPKKTGKYHQIKTTYNGVKYDSMGEAEYAAKLDARLKAGEIVVWYRPKAVVLVDGPKPRDRITYIPDFVIQPKSGIIYYVDFKGSHVTETAVWRLKVKLWRKAIPYELRVAYPSGEEKIVATGKEVT